MPNNTHGLVAHGDEMYGVGTVIFNLCKGLANQGKTPIVVAIRDGLLVEQCKKLGYKTIVLDLPPSPSLYSKISQAIPSLIKHHAWTNKAYESLCEVIHKEAIDSLTMQWPSHVTFVGKAARRLNRKCFWMMPNEIRKKRFGLNRRYYQSVCKRNRIIPLPNSQYTGKSLCNDLSKLSAQVLYLGIDTKNRFNPEITKGISRTALGIDENVNLFGIFAMVTPRKGQDIFFKAMMNVISNTENHLLVVGDDKLGMFDRMQTIAREQGATHRLHCTGWTDKPEEYYSAIDVAVNSRIDPEPFGLSVVEAMSMQKPILVHASGGPAETVLDGQTGWHMPDASVESFQKGIERALADRDRWKQMGIAARKHTLENFSIDAFINNYLTITDR